MEDKEQQTKIEFIKSLHDSAFDVGVSTNKFGRQFYQLKTNFSSNLELTKFNSKLIQLINTNIIHDYDSRSFGKYMNCGTFIYNIYF